MSNYLMFFILVLCGFIPAILVQRIAAQRIRILEKDFRDVCALVSQLAEMQVDAHGKCTASLESIEERILELSVPSSDAALPLERRHQVLTLARRGMALEDIVNHLKAPVGEAELIMNLGKFANTVNHAPAGNKGQVRQYA
jgi:hypothetical protein